MASKQTKQTNEQANNRLTAVLQLRCARLCHRLLLALLIVCKFSLPHVILKSNPKSSQAPRYSTTQVKRSVAAHFPGINYHVADLVSEETHIRAKNHANKPACELTVCVCVCVPMNLKVRVCVYTCFRETGPKVHTRRYPTPPQSVP